MIRFLQSGNKAAKYILGGLLTLLALSMVVYLIPGFMTNMDSTNRSGVVATVGGTEILSQDVTNRTRAQLQQMHYPESLAPFLAPRIMHQMVQQQELRYEAERLGLKVSDQELRDELQSSAYRARLYPGGKWIGQQEYESLVTQLTGQSVSEFENGVRDQLLQRKVFAAVTAGVSVTPAEVEQAYREKNTKVKFQYAVLTLEDVQKGIKPTEADLKAFYQANVMRYQNSVPEKRQLRYFVLLDKDAENAIAISPLDIQRHYNDNLAQYRIPDRVRVRHIQVTVPVDASGKADPKAEEEARAKAQDLLKQVKAGGDFAEIAKKNSQDEATASKGGEMGWVQQGQTDAAFEKVAFAQTPGQISDLVQTSYGFHIIQTEEKEVGRVKPLAEVKDEIEKMLRAEQVGTMLDDKANAAVALAQKQGLDKAAAQSGVKVIESNPVARTGELPGIGASSEVMSSVFAADDKTGPQSGRFASGYVVFQVTKIVPAQTPPFEEIRERVATDFKNERGADLLQKKTKEMADRAHAEHDLAKAAKEAGATVKTSELVGRTSQVPQIGSMGGPASVAFSMKPGDISGPLSTGQNGIVLQLTDRQEPSLNDPAFAQARDGLQEQLTQQKQNQAIELFMSNLGDRLEKEKKVKFNKEEVDRLTKTRG